MELINGLFDFIKNSPSAYHTVDTVEKMLIADGYTELSESEKINLCDGGKYYIKKNGSSLVAFRYSSSAESFMICASHSDSPAFKVKGDFNYSEYTKLAVEKYGGMIYYSWFDRPLSVAGRVYLKSDTGIERRLVNFEKDLAVIPSLAIHMNRGVNDGYKFNPASDLLPIASIGCEGLLGLLSNELSVKKEDIISHDLFLYARDEGKLIGEDYILSPRLDDLACVYASLIAFLSARRTKTIPVFAVFDNEEVGSETKQGAASVFFSELLREIAGENFAKMLPASFMVSADNAHAEHPNHLELADKFNCTTIGGGVVIKYNANQKYTTDAYSDAIFRSIAGKADAKVQSFSNPADMLGGSTLGSIATTKLPIATVDIGLPQLAMHSANETMGVSDFSDMVKALTEFYYTRLVKNGDKTEIKNT